MDAAVVVVEQLLQMTREQRRVVLTKIRQADPEMFKLVVDTAAELKKQATEGGL